MNFFETKFINPAVDSLTVAIPLVFLDLGSSYQDRILMISEQTGEEIEVKTRPVVYDENGIKCGAKLVSLFGKDFVYITFNSKLLGRNYFTGLDSITFRHAFDFAKNVLDFDCDYFVFLHNSLVFDCDLKMDFHLNDEAFSSFIAIHSNIVNTRVFRSKYGSYLDLSYYSGLQFVNRSDATISKPFLKFYSKYLELNEKSNLFLLNSKIQCSPYLRRVEFTIKNSRHFDALGLSNRLVSLLALDKAIIKEFILDAYKKHVGMCASNIALSEGVLSTDFTLGKWVMYQSLLVAMESQNVGLATLLDEFLDSFPSLNPSSKSRKIRAMKAEFKVFMNLQRKFDLSRFRLTPSDVFLSKGNVREGL